MKYFYLICSILFLILLLVYVGGFLNEKRKERKSKKDFDKRQERYRRLI